MTDDVRRIRQKDADMLNALKTGASKANVKAEHGLEARIKYADMLIERGVCD